MQYWTSEFILLSLVFISYFIVNNIIVAAILKKFNFNSNFNNLFIGISPLILVLYAYFFKILGLLNSFSLIYLITVIFFIFFVRKEIYNIIKNIKIDIWTILLFVFYIYLFTYDAVNHITEGGVDVLSSFGFVQSILNGDETAYQPGIALWLSPIYGLLLTYQDLGLISAWIGIVIIFQAYLILLFFGKWTARYFLTFLATPIFYQLNILFIGFTSTSWGLISILAFLIFLINVRDAASEIRTPYIFGLISMLGTALLVPTILPYFLSILGLLFFIDLIKRNKGAYYNFFVPLSTVVGSFVLYLLNLRISNKNYRTEISNLYVTDLYYTESNQFVNLVIDFFSIKGSIRPINNIFDLFGWLTFLFFILFFILSSKHKNQSMLSISFFGSFFGFVTMFGIFEISFFKGRAGIYFLILFLLTLALIANYLHQKYLGKWLFIFSISLAILSAYLFPIEQYRYHNESIYFKTLELVDDKKISKRAIVYTKLPQLNFVSESFEVRDIDKIFENNIVESQQVIVLLDFNEELIDPVLSRQFEYKDVHGSDINTTLVEIRDEKIKRSKEIENEVIKNNFNLIFEDENYKIYSN